MIRSEVSYWLNKQQEWKKVILNDILVKEDILDEDIERYIDICLGNKEIESTVVIDDLVKENSNDSYLKKWGMFME